MSERSVICTKCTKVCRETHKKGNDMLCRSCFLFKINVYLECKKCTLKLKKKKLVHGVCKVCINCDKLEKVCLYQGKDVSFNRLNACGDCKQLFSPNYIFKTHGDTICCVPCHLIKLRDMERNMRSLGCSDTSLYDLENRKLCHMIGCKVHNEFLINAFGGSFCYNHTQELQTLHEKIKEAKTDLEEYNLRVINLQIRKAKPIDDVAFLNIFQYILSTPKYTFDIKDNDLPPASFNSERDYINHLFSI